MTKKERKEEAVRKHNAKYLHDKANPKTKKEIFFEAVTEALKSIN